MYRRKPIRLIALLLSLCMLLTVLPGSGLRAEAGEAEPTAETQLSAAQILSADCEILNYVHPEVFYSGNHVARVASEETLSSYVFLNADGTLTAYYLDDAVKFVDADGNVQEKDLTLVPTVGGYTTEKNDIGLSLPENPANGITLLWNNTAVRILPQGGTAGETVVEGNAVRYVDYYGSGIDLVYTPTLSGLKEDIVLESYTGQNTFTFMLNTGGLRLYSANGRYYLAASKTATDRIDLGDVVTFDARGRFSVGTMTAQTVTAGQIYSLTLTVDEAFLTDPNTVYPVSIDPTLTVSDNTTAGSIEDVSIYQSKPTTNGNWTYLHSGYYDSSYGIARTLFRLTGLTNSSTYQGLTENQILTAEFHIWETSGTSSVNMYLRANTGSSAWTESGATWNSAGVTLGAIYDTVSMGPNAWGVFDITELVKDWKSGTQTAQKGFVLQSSNETSLDKAFYSSEYSGTSYRPYAEVNYITTNNTIGLVNTVLTVNEGATATISKQSVPSGLGVEWSSSNTSVATVDANGVVTGKKAGVATITASATGADSQTCTVYVTIADGVYYLEHTDSECFLYGGGANISDLNNVQITTKKITSPDKLSQMWKIKYLGSGYYSIRPMHKLDLGLYADVGNGNGVRLWSIGTTDTVSGVPLYARWSVTYNMTGYVLKNMNQNDRALVPLNNSLANGTAAAFTNYSSTDTCQRWRFQQVASAGYGCLIYNLETGGVVASPRRGVMPGQTLNISDLNLAFAFYSPTDASQTATWSSSAPGVATVNASTGAVTGVTNGQTTITATKVQNGVTCTYSFDLVVSPLPISGYELDWDPSHWSGIIESNCNCYSYAINNQIKADGSLWYMQQPGQYYGYDIDSINYFSASDVIAVVIQDFEKFTESNALVTFTEVGRYDVCPTGTYKVALVISPINGYHWYRQDSSGCWSHKNGWTPATTLDDDGNIITDPQTAARDSFPTFVGYFALTPWNQYYSLAEVNSLIPKNADQFFTAA